MGNKLFFLSTISLSMILMLPVENVTAARMEIDFNQQCKQQYGKKYRAELIGNTALDWQCRTKKKLPIYRQLDLNAACQNQYPFSDTKYSDFNTPDSWFCEINGAQFELDLNQQCKTEQKRTIYEAINVSDACQNQYGVSNARYTYFYAPDSWFCEV